MKPGRPCSDPRCPNLQPCLLHPSGPFAQAKRSSALYSTPRWRERRREQLEREPWCRTCRASGVMTLAVVADHVTPHEGDEGAFWSGALQSLCWRHSNVKTAHEARERTSRR